MSTETAVLGWLAIWWALSCVVGFTAEDRDDIFPACVLMMLWPLFPVIAVFAAPVMLAQRLGKKYRARTERNRT